MPFKQDLSSLFFTGDEVFCKIQGYRLDYVRVGYTSLMVPDAKNPGKLLYEDVFSFDAATA